MHTLDDPFSAVDAHTAAILFHDCVMDALAKKTVILVTHQVEFLSEVDKILVCFGFCNGERTSYSIRNHRFVWNKNLLDELIEFKVRFSYCKVRLVQGPNYVVSVPLVYETLYRGIQKQISTSSKARKLIALSFLRISLAYMEFKRIYEGTYLTRNQKQP
ncbi:uncharacterized protein LOC112195177 [Rosa chinensis]|uniref:uncharacterized protein LOC112195177 n=1 Tax=Rosa chinensis TaxID=74649 RepID=UPI001AD8A928|nr:uncharacterized protein LOC112195177 [Rosa chinensis]